MLPSALGEGGASALFDRVPPPVLTGAPFARRRRGGDRQRRGRSVPRFLQQRGRAGSPQRTHRRRQAHAHRQGGRRVAANGRSKVAAWLRFPSLLFQAEGIEMSQAYNWLLCPEDQRGPPVPRRGFLPHVASVASLRPGKELKEELTIVFPKDLILGSARGTVSVLGTLRCPSQAPLGPHTLSSLQPLTKARPRPRYDFPPSSVQATSWAEP